MNKNAFVRGYKEAASSSPATEAILKDMPELGSLAGGGLGAGIGGLLGAGVGGLLGAGTGAAAGAGLAQIGAGKIEDEKARRRSRIKRALIGALAGGGIGGLAGVAGGGLAGGVVGHGVGKAVGGVLGAGAGLAFGPAAMLADLGRWADLRRRMRRMGIDPSRGETPLNPPLMLRSSATPERSLKDLFGPKPPLTPPVKIPLRAR